jgi:hypothetical protein
MQRALNIQETRRNDALTLQFTVDISYTYTLFLITTRQRITCPLLITSIL